ncbi:uncharacterized protein [Arachis hypogaea]|nr:uncharacterized protein LOC112715238 isoform X3 [Arachis hypogaea]
MKKIYGLKTHDCHVLLECFLPLVLRGLFSSHDVRSALIGLCSFFKELCSKVLTVKNLEKIEEQIIITLCKLEMIFPPSFFDVMIHLPIHLASEAKIAGPVHYRWMYPIERYLRGLKAYVRNRAHPEGSIAEGYLANECLLFCSRYFNGIETKYNRVGRNWDGAITHGYKVEIKDKVLPIFKQNGRPSRNCKVTRRLSLEEIKQAHLYILKNCDQVTPFICKHKEILEEENPRNVQKRHDQEFSDWFESHPKTSKIANSVAARRKKGIQSLVSKRNLAPSSHLQQADFLSNNDGEHGKKVSSSSHSQVRRTFDSLSNNDGVHGKKASSSSHSQLRRQFDSLSNDDGVDEEEFESDFVAPKKKVRGPTRNLELAKLPAGKRLDINWRMNRPVGPNAKLFKSRCTVLVRDVKNAPLKVKEWADIKIENKIKMFDLVLTYFKVEGRKHLVWAQMNSSYRSYRHLLKKRYFEPYDNPEIARANIPLEMEKEDWDYLVNLWIDEGWQKISQQNKMSRAANSIIHTTGAKGAQQRAEEAFEQTGQEIDRLRLWELTHTRVNGQACNEETQEKLVDLIHFRIYLRNYHLK